MQKVKDLIEYMLGSTPTLEDLRKIVEDTKELDSECRIKFERHVGQRDAEMFSLTIVRGGIV